MTVEQGSTEEVSARHLASQTLSDEKLQKAITDEGVTWTSPDDSVAAVDGDGHCTRYSDHYGIAYRWKGNRKHRGQKSHHDYRG